MWAVVPDFTPCVGRDVVREQATEVCLTTFYGCAVCGAKIKERKQDKDLKRTVATGISIAYQCVYITKFKPQK